MREQDGKWVEGVMASEATHGLSRVLLGTLPKSLGLRELLVSKERVCE